MESSRIADLLVPFLGANLSSEQLSQLSTYLDLLLRWNARMNLTAVRDPEQIVLRHFGESLFAARVLYPDPSLAGGNYLVDIGSGAGFPGLPSKIWAPPLAVALIESQYRKAIFLREAVRAMHLAGIEVFPSRAEDYIPPLPAAGSNATVTCRAVERFERALPVAAVLLSKFQPANSRLALLIGESQMPIARKLLPEFRWQDPIAIPQSRARVLLLGSPQG